MGSQQWVGTSEPPCYPKDPMNARKERRAVDRSPGRAHANGVGTRFPRSSSGTGPYHPAMNQRPAKNQRPAPKDRTVTGDRTVHLRTCPLCEAMCGLEVHVEDREVTLIRADRDDVWSQGYLCPKGTTLGHLHQDPDRLRAPMVRDGDEWREVTWEEAFAAVRRAARRCGGAPRSLGRHRPTSATRRPTPSPSAATSACSSAMAGQPECSTRAGTVDQWPKNVVVPPDLRRHVDIPVPDLDRTDSPGDAWAPTRRPSRASLMACPDVLGRDRRHPGARRQGRRHRPPSHRNRRPGRRVGADRARHRRRPADGAWSTCSSPTAWCDLGVRPTALVDGVDDVRATSWPTGPPERVAATCGVPADTIRRLARELAAAPTRGASTAASAPATRSSARWPRWLVDVVNILTGNLDRPGGLMFAKPVAWSREHAWPTPEWADGRQLRPLAHAGCAACPRCSARCRCRCLAEEIADAGRRAGSGRWSPSPATPSSPRPTPTASTPALPDARLHDQRRQLAQRDHAATPT